jgi:hypothetical protein
MTALRSREVGLGASRIGVHEQAAACARRRPARLLPPTSNYSGRVISDLPSTPGRRIAGRCASREELLSFVCHASSHPNCQSLQSPRQLPFRGHETPRQARTAWSAGRPEFSGAPIAGRTFHRITNVPQRTDRVRRLQWDDGASAVAIGSVACQARILGYRTEPSSYPN